MARETVEAVRQAELHVAQAETDAVKKRDEILLKAQQDSKDIISLSVKEALAKSQSDLQQAQLQGEKTIKMAVQRAEQEVVRIKEIINSKEQAAIALVVSEIT